MRGEIEGDLLVEVAVGFGGGDEFEDQLRAGDAHAQVAVGLEGICIEHVAGAHTDGGGNFLQADAAGADDEVGDRPVLPGEPLRAHVTLVAVGVAGDHRVGQDPGGSAGGVDVRQHLGAAGMAEGALLQTARVGRMMHDEEQGRLARLLFPRSGDGLEPRAEPVDLVGGERGMPEHAHVFGFVRVKADDIDEGRWSSSMGWRNWCRRSRIRSSER